MTTELPRDTGADLTRPVPRPPRGPVGAATPIEPGPRRLGRYELHERLGEGGMGVVYRASDDHGREVAIKVLRAHIAGDQHARERLRREVATLARVHHPRIAAVIDADVDGPSPYVVTEYVPGPPLDVVVEERGPLQGEALLRLGRGLGEALSAIHRAGIVHRDLKPGNVLMVGDDPVVIDFGIAQVADDVRLTMTGMVMGTPGYLSPEVVEGGEVSEATDWWGWAATLGYAASGQPPFGRGPLTVVLDRVLRGRLQLEGVDPRLRPLLAAALDPDPARRPHQHQVLDALERYARREDVTGALPMVDATRVAPTRRPDPTRVAPTHRPDPTRVAPARVADPGRATAYPESRQAPVPEAMQPGPAPVAPYPTSAPPAPGEQGGPDPRLYRSSRSGTLATLLLLFVGLASIAPFVAWGLLAVWGILTRTVDRSLTGLVVRRHEAGRRRSDVPMLVLASPVHLVVAVVGTAFALLVPVGVAGLSALAVSALAAPTDALAGVGPDHPLAMGTGALLGGLLAWWGVGARSLRRGSRTVVRALVPQGLPTVVVATLCGVGGAALAVWGYVDGGPVSWWPMGPDFDPRQWLPALGWGRFGV